MPELGPVSWAELVTRLRKLGFEGPFQGGKHPYMTKGDLVLTVPNPHRKDIGIPLLTRISKQAKITREEWRNK